MRYKPKYSVYTTYIIVGLRLKRIIKQLKEFV